MARPCPTITLRRKRILRDAGLLLLSLAVLLVLALSFLGAILGGLCGRLYHRRVDKYPNDQVAREDA